MDPLRTKQKFLTPIFRFEYLRELSTHPNAFSPTIRVRVEHEEKTE
jgi:hypothetical protein